MDELLRSKSSRGEQTTSDHYPDLIEFTAYGIPVSMIWGHRDGTGLDGDGWAIVILHDTSRYHDFTLMFGGQGRLCRKGYVEIMAWNFKERTELGRTLIKRGLQDDCPLGAALCLVGQVLLRERFPLQARLLPET